MTHTHLELLTYATALGASLVAGVCFAFSSFVLPALRRLPAPQGLSAMQAINAAALTLPFLSVFVGTALCCALLLGASLLQGGASEAWPRLGGPLVYLVLVVAVTRARNLPLNDDLARALPEAKPSERLWQSYVRRWTFWNNVRWVAALVASAGLWASAG